MVSTRRSGATEPLERLETPPKRTRKPKPRIPESIEETMDAEASPEVIRAIPIEIDTQTFFEDISVESCVNVDLTSSTEENAKSTNADITSTKRQRDETSPENVCPAKRIRSEEESKKLYLSMFPPKDESDDPVTPRGLGGSLRRRRQQNSLRKADGYSSLPRQKPSGLLIGDNPFGIETFSEREKADRAASLRKPLRADTDDHDVREERSAAPEPETPRKGLFGSLRNIGSAVAGRVLSPFKGASPQPTTVPQPRTEPSKRIAAWDIHYPQIELPQDENEPPEDELEEPESDRKRKAFEEKHGRTERRYDHLHTVPASGDKENMLPSVMKAVPQQNDNEAPSSIEAFAKQRRERRQKFQGQTPPSQPKRAPLFGPNSHSARRTQDPILQSFFEGGEHPAMRQAAGNKRSFEQAMPDDAARANTPSRSFGPHVDDDDEEEADEDLPSTPLAKKQKLAEKSNLRTPRSALKAPGSIGRSGRSARFNENPIASIKRMSPIAGSGPASYNSPANLFAPYTEQEDSPASNGGLTPSPNTHKNTLTNTGKQHRSEVLFKQHPGDLLSQAMNEATPADLRGKRIPYVWKDPQDPSWKPSLFNPRPGTFRLLDEDEIMEEQQYLEEMELGESSESPAPDPPSTPRMSHAELPKVSASAPPVVDSTSAFEAANLEKRRADASKTKPRKSSKLAEVTSARSRSPSPPGLDSDAADVSDESAKTPSPVIGPAADIWNWDSSTNEYISSNPRYPDFAYNPQDELVPAFAIKSRSGSWDDTITGPDGRTELARQRYYQKKYDDAWAAETFPFAPAQTYEEAGVGSAQIHELIRKNDERYPEVVKKCDDRFASEWEAHEIAIDNAAKENKDLIATHPDRNEMMEDDEEL